MITTYLVMGPNLIELVIVVLIRPPIVCFIKIIPVVVLRNMTTMTFHDGPSRKEDIFILPGAEW